MKKLYFSIIVILIPILVYCAIFFSNDPYNYFGCADIEGDTSNLIGKMLDFRNNRYEAVIIGDSRIADYDVSGLSDSSGLKYVNMAYGGCITEEMAYLLGWCIENQQNTIKEVYIITSFYNMNTLQQQNRVLPTEKVIASPLAYAFSAENAAAMFNNIKKSFQAHAIDATNDSAILEEQKAEHFRISEENMTYYLSGYSYDYDVIEQLCVILDRCNESGISVKIVLPPWWEGYYKLLDKWGLTSALDEYKEMLSKHALVYDFEFRDCTISKNYEDFSDYSHFHGESFKTFVNVIVMEDSSYCRVWKDGKIIRYPL